MKRCYFLPAWILLFCFLAGTRAVGADLARAVEGVVRDPLLAKAELGVEIVRLGPTAADCKALYRHGSDVPLIPASDLKVITASAALDRLGPDFKFRTQLVFHNGDLLLIGDGDPAFGDAEILTRVGWDVDTVFKHWAAQIKTLNLGPIKNIVVDDSIFDSDLFHPNWSTRQRLDWYEPEVAGMNLNINCLDFFIRPTQPGKLVTCLTNPVAKFFQIRNECRTGEGRPSIQRAPESNDMTVLGKNSTPNEVPLRVTIHDPPLFAANVLAETLSSAGVTHTGDVHRDRTLRNAIKKAGAIDDKAWQVIGINETPLSLVLARANKNSINLYGECLCKRLGAEVTTEPGSWQNGTAAVAEFLKKVGVPATGFHLDDGCGLSKENHVTASAMARILIYDYFSSNAKTFMDSMAVAGSEGTLLERFRGSSLRGRVFAKSGTVDGVSCLSGYLHARDNQWYVFSILTNKIYNGAGKAMQEAIVTAIDDTTAE